MIRTNVAKLCAGTAAEVMVVVKADAYGHGAVPCARAALESGATWLGVCTLGEALELRAAGLRAPVLAWLIGPGQALHLAVEAAVDLSAASIEQFAEIVAAARPAGRPARAHLKIDTGLRRNGATLQAWSRLLKAAAKAQAGGLVEVVGVWSHLACADVPGHPAIDGQLRVFTEALAEAGQFGITPQVRHIANSAATLTRPDAHFDLVRPGIAVYGLSPIPGETFGLTPAMTAHAKVLGTKRVGAGEGVSYGHTYHTTAETTLALIPLGYADGVPRAASNVGPISINDKRYTIAGRVCMDQVMLDCGDDGVRAGDEAILFGPGQRGEPTATEWADAVGTINYEIVTRFGSSRIPRGFAGERRLTQWPGQDKSRL